MQDGRGGYKAKPTEPHDYATKQRILLQNSRKLDCCATLQIRCVDIFDDYFLDKAQCKTDNSIKVAKSRILKSLDELLTNENQNDLCKTTRFYVKLPLNSVHINHPVGSLSTIGQYVDPRIVSKIYSLVEKNISSVLEVKRWLDKYVENELFCGVPESQKPRKTNRRYYPCRQDLRNHIIKAISAFKYSNDDQESLAHKICEWQAKDPTSKFFYRTRDEIPENQDGNKSQSKEKKFLFIHQELWQQRLLERYGNDLVLMDATYKITKYTTLLRLRSHEHWIQSCR